MGLLYQTSGGGSVKFDPEFRDLAEVEFITALQLDEELYQAHENLAYLFGWPDDETSRRRARRKQRLATIDDAAKQAKQLVEEVFVGWDPTVERHRRVLYNRTGSGGRRSATPR